MACKSTEAATAAMADTTDSLDARALDAPISCTLHHGRQSAATPETETSGETRVAEVIAAETNARGIVFQGNLGPVHLGSKVTRIETNIERMQIFNIFIVSSLDQLQSKDRAAILATLRNAVLLTQHGQTRPRLRMHRTDRFTNHGSKYYPHSASVVVCRC